MLAGGLGFGSPFFAKANREMAKPRKRRAT
jgi:hypothetical protein